jgi:hypothetical protein
MNTAWASLQGFDSAIFGYSGVQRRIGGVPLSLLTWLGSGSEGQAGLDHRFHETGLMHGIHLASEAL